MTVGRGDAFRAGGRPTLRVSRGGARLQLDEAAVRLLGESTTHVRLLYDRDTRRIGVMPTTATDPDGFAIAGGAVAAPTFVSRYRIPVGPAFRVEREGDLVVAVIPAAIPDGFVDLDEG